MVMLFQQRPLREKLRGIIKLTYEHTKNLAYFVGVYKGVLLLLKEAGRAVVLIGLVKLGSEKGWPILKKYSFPQVYPVLACATWAVVMWLFEYHRHVLHPSLAKSMDFLYHDSNSWTTIQDFLPSPATVAVLALTWINF
ncbi:hypothetical protein B5M09_010334 [Aphanomyces astaci]|uniref:Uncharacterized protein n=1 Tax=Aphanomyces astaci TaxID=112090 RepID=A0A3R7Y461_APHAT|nr:hypothetical protein B5M09_010334 [Aphanomyces astaci]